MRAILAVTIPFFALVLAGYVAAARRMLPDSAIPGLNGFVLFFALRCLLLRFGAGLPLARLIDPVVIGVYLLAALLMVFFTIAVTLSARVCLSPTRCASRWHSCSPTRMRRARPARDTCCRARCAAC